MLYIPENSESQQFSRKGGCEIYAEVFVQRKVQVIDQLYTHLVRFSDFCRSHLCDAQIRSHCVVMLSATSVLIPTQLEIIDMQAGKVEIASIPHVSLWKMRVLVKLLHRS